MVNALAGGLAFAVVGAFCGAIVGGLFGSSYYRLGLAAIFKGIEMGVYAGIASGVVGILIYAVAAFSAGLSGLLAPFRRLAKRVSLGQILGTSLVCASFAIFEFAKALLQGVTFAQMFNGDDGLYFVCAAPVLMICGAIAAALTKSDT